MRDCVILEFSWCTNESLARVDIPLGTKIKSLAFVDPILDFSREKLHMLVWMHDIKIFIDIALNSPTQVDPFRYWNHVTISYNSNISSKLNLEIQLLVRNTEQKRITSILLIVYDLKSYGRRGSEGRGGGVGNGV